MRGVSHGGAAAPPAAGAAAHLDSRLAGLVPALAVAVAAGAVFAAGGTSQAALVWIGGVAVVAAAFCLAAGAVGLLPLPAPGAAALVLAALLAAYALWSGVSIAWSIAPDRSWDAVNRSLAYLALLVLGMVAGTLVRSAPRAAAAALGGVLTAGIAWALAGKVVPALGAETERSARLHGSFDYWNALALAIALAAPLWLWLASAREQRPAVRAAAVAALTGGVVALLLTGSRGGLLVLAVAVAAWLALAPLRLESAAALALALPLGASVGAWALARPGLVQAGVEAGDRTRDGALLGILLVAAGAAAFAAALALVRAEETSPPRPDARRALGRGAALAGTALLVGALAVLLVRAGGPAGAVDAFTNPPEEQLTNVPGGRFGHPSSNHRWTWWNEAWDVFEIHWARGTGAGSFELARRPIRQDAHAPQDPHNLALKALSETGLVGFALVLGAVVAGALAAAAALRRLRGPERAAAAALVAGAAAWLVHALLDMTWELAAVTAPVLLALGALAVSGRGPREEPPAARRPLAAAAAVALAVAVVLSLVSPRLAERRLDEALDALTLGRPGAAIERARDAQALNPLAVEPIHLEAAAYEAVDRLGEAEALYIRAVELQPYNAITWYELGRFEYEARGNLRRALVYLDRSWGLDRWAVETGRLLDAVRADLAAEGA